MLQLFGYIKYTNKHVEKYLKIKTNNNKHGFCKLKIMEGGGEVCCWLVCGI